MMPLPLPASGPTDGGRKGAEQGAHPGAPREQLRGAKQEPGDDRRAKGGAEDTELRLLQLRPVEREGREYQ